MFNLEKGERFIILFLLVVLLMGLSAVLYQKSNSIIDVRIRAFDYSGEPAGIKKININDADESTLMRLPGIGKSTARRIAEYRDTEGPFRSVEEIKKIKGIKDNLFNKIKDKIAVE